MKKKINSLSFKIGAIIILVEMIVQTVLGIIYINRFFDEVDLRIDAQAQLPGVLMNAGLLSFDSVSDSVTMRELVGDELISGMVVGVNGNVFYALDPTLLGMDISNVPDVDIALFNINNSQNVVIRELEKVIAISPIYAADQRTPRFFVYTEVSNLGATAEKTELTRLFIFGSLITMLITSLVIIISFNWMIINPIGDLAEILKRVRDGNLSTRVQETKSQDEIGFLQRGTNEMIEAREGAVAKIIHLTRILRAIRNVNQLITQERDLDRLLERACQHLIEVDSYIASWILLVNKENTPIKFVHRDMRGNTLSLTDLLERCDLTPCSHTTLAQKGMQHITNTSDLCMDCFLSDSSKPYNTLAIRLEFNGIIYGMLNITMLTKSTIDSEEVSLFEELAGDISFALYSLELEEKRIKAEEELRESEKKYRSLFAQIADPIFIFDKEKYYFLDCNQSALNRYGYTLEELRQMTPQDLHPQEDLLEVEKNINDEDNTLEHSYLHVTKGGEPIRVEVNTAPIEYEGQVAWISIVRDITERVRAQEEKQQMEVHLRHGQKLESIGTLAGGVAHEINNPIMGIMNYAQLIGERLEPSQKQLSEFSSEIIHETKRVAEIVHNLLTFARQEKQSHSPAQMVDIMNGTLTLIRTIIKRDQITLEVNVPNDLPKIKCRSQQIQQVLMNLLTNARDTLNERYPEYNPDKIINISVKLFEKEGRRWLRTTVEDHGAGIPVEIRERIFDPFYTTKDRTTGTGLGLSISLGIVQDHHGKLTFESEEGKGTRFYLDLPVDNGWELEK